MLRIARKAEKNGQYGSALRAWDRVAEDLNKSAPAKTRVMKDAKGNVIVLDEGMPPNGMLTREQCERD